MAVLQDFEALTPNLLARTIETVEGGGIVVLLLSNLTSLTQLYSLTMDVHVRLRTESHQVGGGAQRRPLRAASRWRAALLRHMRRRDAVSHSWTSWCCVLVCARVLQDVSGRFNERLVLSLASCANCILMDDELNILPTSR